MQDRETKEASGFATRAGRGLRLCWRRASLAALGFAAFLALEAVGSRRLRGAIRPAEERRLARRPVPERPWGSRAHNRARSGPASG